MTDPAPRSAARLATLRAINRALAHPLDTVEILRRVHRELQRVLDAPIWFFGIYDPHAQSVDVIWQVHNGAELPGGQFPLGNGVTSQVIRTRQPHLIRHWSLQAPPAQVQYATDHAGLPESAITVPAVFDDRVIGVLSVQSYHPEAFDDEDLALLQDATDQATLALSVTQPRWGGRGDAPGHAAELEALLASLPAGVLVLDEHGHLIRLNHAARSLLCLDDASLILGYPVDRPQGDRWPLGTAALTEQLRPLIDRLTHGENPSEQLEVTLAGGSNRFARCQGALLFRDGAPAGGVLLLHELARGRAA